MKTILCLSKKSYIWVEGIAEYVSTTDGEIGEGKMEVYILNQGRSRGKKTYVVR